MFMDSIGQLTVVSPQQDKGSSAETPYVPGWFAELVRPQLVGRAVRVVAVDGSNPIVIVGEPADEIAEAWHDFSALAYVWLTLNALVLAILYVVLGRVLDPLAHLSKGMLNLEDGHYATRLRAAKGQGACRHHRTLQHARRARSTRRATRTAVSIASSSPCRRRSGAPSPTSSTTRRAPACSASPPMPPRSRTSPISCPMVRTAEITRRVGEILSITERLKLMNRALLKKLRPGPLGKVEALRAPRRAHRRLSAASSRHAHRCRPWQARQFLWRGDRPDPLSLHPGGHHQCHPPRQAENLTIDLAEEAAPRRNGGKRPLPELSLSISDDGKGIAPATPKGFGLSTMTERVRSLGGTCVIESAPSKGTTIRVDIPVQRGNAARARAPELVGELS